MRREGECDAAELRAAVVDEVEEARRELADELAEDERRAHAELDEARESALADARALADEARAFRDAVLGDLAERRHTALRQLEQLTAAREHLVVALGEARDAFAVTSEALDDIVDATDQMLIGAKSAADAAAQRAAGEPVPTVDALEDFLADLRSQSRPGPARGSGDGSDAEPEVATLFARIRADAGAFIEPTNRPPSVDGASTAGDLSSAGASERLS